MPCLQHYASTPPLNIDTGRLCLHSAGTACLVTGDTACLQRSAGNMDENAVGEKIAGLKRELGFWDKYLANGFVAGDSFTIADCAAAPYFLIAERYCVVQQNWDVCGGDRSKRHAVRCAGLGPSSLSSPTSRSMWPL